MESVFGGFRARTSDLHDRVIRRFATVLIVVSGALFLLAGCDTSSVDATVADQQARALTAFGEGSVFVAHADIHALLAESGPFVEVLPDDAREAFHAALADMESTIGIDPRDDVQGAYLAASLEADVPHMAAILYVNLEGVSEPASFTTMMERDLAGHSVRVDTMGAGRNVFLTRYLDEAVVMTTSETWMVRTLASLDRTTRASTLPAILSEVENADAWIVMPDVQVLTDRMDEFQDSALAPFAAQVSSVAAGLVLNDGDLDVRLLAAPAGSTSVDDLASLLRGGKALVRMQDDVPSALRDLVDGADIDTRGGLVRVRVQLTTESVRNLMENSGW